MVKAKPWLLLTVGFVIGSDQFKSGENNLAVICNLLTRGIPGVARAAELIYEISNLMYMHPLLIQLLSLKTIKQLGLKDTLRFSGVFANIIDFALTLCIPLESSNYEDINLS